MPKPARFTDDDVLDAALARLGEAGPRISIADIARELGGPVGSIYHRFPSREVLMVRLWLRSIHRFQRGLFELAEISDAHEAMIAMALHVPQYCRAHSDEAVGLTLYRQDRLLLDCPDEMRDAVTTMNDSLVTLMTDATRRRYGDVGPDNLKWVEMATQVTPYGLVRPYLGRAIPPEIDTAVAAAADAILQLGDGPGKAPAAAGARPSG